MALPSTTNLNKLTSRKSSTFACSKCNKSFASTKALNIHRATTQNVACEQRDSESESDMVASTVCGTDSESGVDSLNDIGSNRLVDDGFESEDWETDSDDHTDLHPRPDCTFGQSATFLDDIRLNDQFAGERKDCLYFPFNSKMDWEVAAWLNRSGMSMSVIDEFFRLEYVRVVIPVP